MSVNNSFDIKYMSVVTNPPYMGGSGMQAKLTDYLNKYYSIAKADHNCRLTTRK